MLHSNRKIWNISKITQQVKERAGIETPGSGSTTHSKPHSNPLYSKTTGTTFPTSRTGTDKVFYLSFIFLHCHFSLCHVTHVCMYAHYYLLLSSLTRMWDSRERCLTILFIDVVLHTQWCTKQAVKKSGKQNNKKCWMHRWMHSEDSTVPLWNSTCVANGMGLDTKGQCHACNLGGSTHFCLPVLSFCHH